MAWVIVTVIAQAIEHLAWLADEMERANHSRRSDNETQTKTSD